MRNWSVVLVLALIWGCSDDRDRRAPAAPTLYPVTSPTDLRTQILSGSAEPGSTVVIEGGAETVTVQADRYTAEFHVEVPLVVDGGESADGAESKLVLTATDGSGNKSEPTTASIVYRAPRADRLSLRLSHDTVSADEGTLTARARIENPNLASLSGFEVSFSVEGVDGIEPLTATSDESGVAEVTFEGLVSATEFARVKASAATNASASDSQPFSIVAGVPAALDFALVGVKGGSIAAGTPVDYTYRVEDAHGNTSSAPVIVTVDHPGAQILDDHVSGDGTITDLTRASSAPYTITASVSGSKLEASEALLVRVAQGARNVELILSVASMAVDDSVTAFVIVRDRFGNVIDAPAAELGITRADGSSASGAFVMSGDATFTLGEPDIYRIRATFDDGDNAAASADAYVVVEATPDLAAPDVRIVSVNGYGVCPDGTLEANTPADCTDTTPAVTFQRDTVVVAIVEVDDDRALSEVSFKAFGSGVSADDFTLLGAGNHVPGTPVTVNFVFRINGSAVPGDARLVAQAKDASGNTTNSSMASLRIDLGIDAVGNHTIAPIAVDNALAFTSPRDVVAFGSTIYVTNRDSAAPVVYRIQGQAISTWATFPDRPEFLTVDTAGNLFVALDNSDEIWKVDATGATSVYQDQNSPNPPADPEGLSMLGADKPSTGRFGFVNGGQVQDENCVDLAGEVYEFDVDSGAVCAGAAGNCGSAFDVCVGYDGSLSDARTKLAQAINAQSTLVSAFVANECGNNNASCVFLVAKNAGAGVSVALSVLDGGDITADDVQDGQDASLLYAVDRNGNQEIFEFQAPSTPDASPLGVYDMNAQPRGVAAALRGSASTPWLHLLATDDGNDELHLYDSGTDLTRVIADQNDGLDVPFDVLWSATGCAIVANQGSGEILAIGNVDGPGPISVALIAHGFDDLRGIAWEGIGESASLLVVDGGFDVILRVTPTTASGDCF